MLNNKAIIYEKYIDIVNFQSKRLDKLMDYIYKNIKFPTKEEIKFQELDYDKAKECYEGLNLPDDMKVFTEGKIES